MSFSSQAERLSPFAPRIGPSLSDTLSMPSATPPSSPHPAPRLGQTAPAAADVALLFTRASRLLPEIGAEAAEREQRRELPYALVRRIAQAGLLTLPG